MTAGSSHACARKRWMRAVAIGPTGNQATPAAVRGIASRTTTETSLGRNAGLYISPAGSITGPCSRPAGMRRSS